MPNEQKSHNTRISDSSLYDEKCVKCGAVDEQLDRPCRAADESKPAADLTDQEVDKLFERIEKRKKAEGRIVPTPFPLEGVEIPEYEPVPDRTLRWLMQASSDPAKAAMSRELAERRLADRDTIRIPRDVAERMAADLIAAHSAEVAAWGIPDMASDYPRYAAILRGETDA